MKLTTEQRNTLGDIYLAIEREGKPVDAWKIGVFPVVKSLIRRNLLTWHQGNVYTVNPDRWDLARQCAADVYERLDVQSAASACVSAVRKHDPTLPYHNLVTHDTHEYMELVRAWIKGDLPDSVEKAFAEYDRRLGVVEELRGTRKDVKNYNLGMN